jgi:RNA polymerase sigma-70 factor (ECF subfamily)
VGRAVTEAKNAWVERLFATHRGALQAFFYRRVRFRADATDLAQEVYERMLRVKDLGSIRDTEAYLYTVAGNLAKEHAARERRRGIRIDVEDTAVQEELVELTSFDSQVDAAQQVRRLREVLRQLPPAWHAALVLHYAQGFSYDEVARRLGISPRMVKRYLGKALGHCRRRMVRPS